MKILLWDVDSKIPNLALMKISAYHKSLGDEVVLKKGLKSGLERWFEFDMGYASCIFFQNAGFPKDLSFPLQVGGPGAHTRTLPPEIEHMMPDYGLYNCDFSMGFTTRGCPRNCRFCNVPKIEGKFKEHAHPKEFIRPDHNKVILLDNNFIVSDSWTDKLDYIKERGYKICISQGFDARLVGRREAEILAKYWPFYDLNFKETTLYTAWDQPGDEEKVLNGIKNLIGADIPKTHIIVYVLVGFNTTIDQDLHRFKSLVGAGVRPFIMPYNNEPHPMKRWGNRPAIYMKIPFEEYNRLKELGFKHPEEVAPTAKKRNWAGLQR